MNIRFKWTVRYCICILLCKVFTGYRLYSSSITSIDDLREISNPKNRFVARVAYDGSRFHGWQLQPSVPTVQGKLNSAFSKRFGSPIKVSGASRTDIGVHAHGQTIHFEVPEETNVSDLSHVEFTLNRLLLPSDICIYNVSSCPLGNAAQIAIKQPFHAIKSTTGKAYTYRLCTNTMLDPFARHYYGHMSSLRHFHYPLFCKALQCFVGTHDFNAFTNLVTRTSKMFQEEKKHILYNTTRTVYRIDCEEDGLSGYYIIRLYVKSAVYRMIRNIIGTSVAVATGKIPIEKISQWLNEKECRQKNMAMSAPPTGLFLEHVFYDHYGPDMLTYWNICEEKKRKKGEAQQQQYDGNSRGLYVPTLI